MQPLEYRDFAQPDCPEQTGYHRRANSNVLYQHHVLWGVAYTDRSNKCLPYHISIMGHLDISRKFMQTYFSFPQQLWGKPALLTNFTMNYNYVTQNHDVMAYQITNKSTVCSTVCFGEQKNQRSTLIAFVKRKRQCLISCPHKDTAESMAWNNVTRCASYYVLMVSSCEGCF